MRFKNFSDGAIEYERIAKAWVHPAHPGSFVEVVESRVVEAGDVTADFDPSDPTVQLMLKAHPELRPIVVLGVWDRLRTLRDERLRLLRSPRG